MKLSGIAAAALLALAAIAPVGLATPAEAQRRVEVHERTVVRTGPGHRGPGYNRPGYNRHRATTRKVCTNRFRNGRRVRVCRTVRRYR